MNVILAERAKAQILKGVKAVRAGDTLIAELYFSLAIQSLKKLQELLDAGSPPPAKPIRKLCVVSNLSEHDPEIAPWMAKKFGEPDDGAA